MSLTKNELVYLMAYADGEVDDDEMAEVEALIDKSEEAQAIMAQQAALRDWVVRDGERRATEARADKIADLVMAAVEQAGGAEVIAIERGRAARELGRQRIKEFGALAAVAAAIALFVLWPSQEAAPVAQKDAPAAVPSSAAPPAEAPPPSAVPEPSVMAAAEMAAPGVDIQAVESPEHQLSIFYVPGVTGANAQASSVVVWIGED